VLRKHKTKKSIGCGFEQRPLLSLMVRFTLTLLSANKKVTVYSVLLNRNASVMSNL
jgi:hypothetical protein